MSYIENLFSLDGKVAIVTGAARGNGKEIAEALLRADATVILVDILQDDLIKTTSVLQANLLKAVNFCFDITDSVQLEKFVEVVKQDYKRVDILVNNAGVSFSHKLLDYPNQAWEKTYKVNLQAPWQLSKVLGKIMKEQGSGSIINITSLNAEMAFPDNPAYVAFKGALRQLTKSLALDLGKYGIRANNVGPGYIKTDMTKVSWEDPVKNKQRKDRTALGRWGHPKDLAGIIIFLASDASSYVTGQDIYVDGGWLIKGL